MNKKILTTAILVTLLIGAAACNGAQTVAGTSTAIQKNITVTGTGIVKVVPDIAYINVGVTSQSENVSDAIQQNSNQAQTIKDELIASGIAEEDIQTSSFSVYPQSNYDYSGNITGTVFVVNNNVYVTVRDLSTL